MYYCKILPLCGESLCYDHRGLGSKQQTIQMLLNYTGLATKCLAANHFLDMLYCNVTTQGRYYINPGSNTPHAYMYVHSGCYGDYVNNSNRDDGWVAWIINSIHRKQST